jgi:NAD(P)H dehydrogenase (quinone)
MKIVITGASGQLAAGVIDSALETVEPSDLILVTRSPEGLRELAEKGADVRHGDFNDPATLPSAFDGGDRLLLISTDAVGDRIEQHRTAIKTAVEVRIDLVAYTSIVNPVETNPAVVVREHMATEKMLRESAVSWVFLRNSIYADMQVDQMNIAAASGQLVTNNGKGSVAYVTRRDCAAAAAAVLVTDGHGDKAYDITGPDLIDAQGRASIFSEVTGTPIEVVYVDDDDAYAQGVADATGLPFEMARAFATFGQAVRGDHLDTISDDFEALTGRKAQSLKSLLEAS